jgi:hypothetical protein
MDKSLKGEPYLYPIVMGLPKLPLQILFEIRSVDVTSLSWGELVFDHTGGRMRHITRLRIVRSKARYGDRWK